MNRIVIPFIILLLFYTTGFSLMSQTPTTQDCLGAIPVCDFIYVEEHTASGNGNYNELPTNQSCPSHCMDGEKNSRWYIFTVIESGTLRFEITPQTPSDDYDWAVFNLTNHSCDEIYGNPTEMLKSCNAAGGPSYQGATGISTPNGGMVSCNGGGPTSKWNADMYVWEGDTYVLVVSDWTQTPGGYTLDFSASTAAIFDDQRPFVEYVGGDLITACGTNEILLRFNENVKCSSVQAGDFVLEGPGGPYVIDSIYGYNCYLGGANEREYILFTNPPIYQGGDFTLGLTLFSAISDACNNYAQSAQFHFDINLDAPTANAGEDQSIAYGASATLNGSAYGGSGSYSFSWDPISLLDDPTSPQPSTINLTVSTPFYLLVSDMESYCQSQDTVWVNIIGGPLSIGVSTSSAAVCRSQRADLFASTGGGSGSYLFSWSSSPIGFSSNLQNPSVYPLQDTWYKVEVSDGFSMLADSVFVAVYDTPMADAGNDQVINEGTTTTLSGTASGGSGTYLYQWEPASWLVQNDIANPTTLPLYEPTVFTLLVSDENGCYSDLSQMLVNPAGDGLSAFPMSDPVEVCQGEAAEVVANATGGGLTYNYSWTSSPSGFTSDQPVFTVSPLVTTRYDLLLLDQFGNEFTAHTTIIVNPLPIIDLIPAGSPLLGEDTIVACVRDSVYLDAGFDDNPLNTEYYWLNASYVNRLFVARTNGSWIDFQTHAVRVTNGVTGCVNVDSVTIMFDFTQCNIDIQEYTGNLSSVVSVFPNPNNGSFTLLANEQVEDLQIFLFDSRGSVLHSELWQGKTLKGFEKQYAFPNLFPGIYIVRLQSQQGIGAIRMVIK